MNFINFYNYISANILYYFSNDKYWLEKRLSQELPILKFKRLKFRDDSIIFGDKFIGNISFDNEVAIIKDELILTQINKDNPIFFHKDFVELSQMVYFIFCYLFYPNNPQENYSNRWKIFNKSLIHTKITSFGYAHKTFRDLLKSLNNGNDLPEFAPTLDNFKTCPPILTNFGFFINKNGFDYSLLHYTVRLPHKKDEHISLVLLEKDNKKFYKLSQQNIPGIDLTNKIDYHKYFKFDINEYSEYMNVSEFIGEFSMLIIKGINPDYKENFHPTYSQKMIFDMMSY